MIYYVSHSFCSDNANIERARKITHDLQIRHLENSYICPLLAFSHINYGEVDNKDLQELYGDLLMICDGVIIAAKISQQMKADIELAKRLGMEVFALGKDGEICSFTE